MSPESHPFLCAIRATYYVVVPYFWGGKYNCKLLPSCSFQKQKPIYWIPRQFINIRFEHAKGGERGLAVKTQKTTCFLFTECPEIGELWNYQRFLKWSFFSSLSSVKNGLTCWQSFSIIFKYMVISKSPYLILNENTKFNWINSFRLSYFLGQVTEILCHSVLWWLYCNYPLSLLLSILYVKCFLEIKQLR